MLVYYKQHPEARGGLVKKAASDALARFFLGLRKQTHNTGSLWTKTRQFDRKNVRWCSHEIV